MNKPLKNILFIVAMLVILAGGAVSFMQINHLNMFEMLFNSNTAEIEHPAPPEELEDGTLPEDFKMTEPTESNTSRTALAWQGMLLNLIFFSSVAFVTYAITRLNKNWQRKGVSHGKQSLP